MRCAPMGQIIDYTFLCIFHAYIPTFFQRETKTWIVSLICQVTYSLNHDGLHVGLDRRLDCLIRFPY